LLILNKIIVFPAFTPRAKNNPAYRTVLYDEETFDIIDMKNYYYDLDLYRQYTNLTPVWELEYVFSDVYSLDVTYLFDICQSLITNSVLFHEFQIYWPSLSQFGYSSITHADYDYYCMLTTFFTDADE